MSIQIVLAVLVAALASRAVQVDCGSAGVITDYDVALSFNCTRFLGSLRIQGQSVETLVALSTVTQIDGGLIILSNANLTSLAGLDNLSVVADLIDIRNNTQLSNISALSAVAGPLATSLTIQYNPMLTSLDGLQGITAVGNTISLAANGLVDLQGLSVAGNITTLSIKFHSLLRSLRGLENITGVFNVIELQENPALDDITALSNISGSVGSIMISNSAVTTLDGLQGITEIPSLIHLVSNTKLADISALSAVRGPLNRYLWIEDSPILVSLAALHGIASVGDFLLIRNLGVSLLTGLEGLKTVQSDIAIQNNPALVSIQALANISGSLNFLTIVNNTQLFSLDGLEGIRRITEAITITGPSDLDGNPMLDNFCAICTANITAENSKSYLYNYLNTSAPFTGVNLSLSWALAGKPCGGGAVRQFCARPPPTLLSPSLVASGSATRMPSSTLFSVPSMSASPMPTESASPTSPASMSGSSTPTTSGIARVVVNASALVINQTVIVAGPTLVVGNLSLANASIVVPLGSSSGRPVVVVDGTLNLSGTIITLNPTALGSYTVFEASGGITGTPSISVDDGQLNLNPCERVDTAVSVDRSGRSLSVLLTAVEDRSRSGCGGGGGGGGLSPGAIAGIVVAVVLVCCACVLVAIAAVVILALTQKRRKLIKAATRRKRKNLSVSVDGTQSTQDMFSF